MQKFLIFLALFGIVVFVVENSDQENSPVRQSEAAGAPEVFPVAPASAGGSIPVTGSPARPADDVLARAADLGTAAQDVSQQAAELNLVLLTSAYNATPEPLRCLFGLFFLAVGGLALIGLVTVTAGVRLWNRHL